MVEVAEEGSAEDVGACLCLRCLRRSNRLNRALSASLRNALVLEEAEEEEEEDDDDDEEAVELEVAEEE